MQLTLNFVSLKDTEEEHVMHSKRDNIKFTSYNVANEVVDEVSEFFCSRYQCNVEILTEETEFTFDSVQLMYYESHRVNFRCGGSYIDSPDWINPKNKDDKCFQYAVMVASDYEDFK